VVAAMPIHSFTPGVFGPDAIAAMSEAFDAACKELGETGHPEVARDVIAGRIIAAARFGERDPVRLREAAFRKSDKRVKATLEEQAASEAERPRR
jgi:hypothetical protein